MTQLSRVEMNRKKKNKKRNQMVVGTTIAAGLVSSYAMLSTANAEQTDRYEPKAVNVIREIEPKKLDSKVEKVERLQEVGPVLVSEPSAPEISKESVEPVQTEEAIVDVQEVKTIQISSQNEKVVQKTNTPVTTKEIVAKTTPVNTNETVAETQLVEEKTTEEVFVRQGFEVSEYISVDYFEMANDHSIIVYVNNAEKTFELAPSFLGKDLDKEFTPGTEVELGLIKTSAGLIVGSIEEIEKTTVETPEEVAAIEEPAEEQQEQVTVEQENVEKSEVEEMEIKETLGSLTGLADSNTIELDVLGEFVTFNAGGNPEIQKEISEYVPGSALVVRYVETKDGQNLIKDIVKVYDPEKGDLEVFVEADFFDQIDEDTIEVFVDNKLVEYQLSESFIERNLNNEFAPGTKVSLACVKTDVGLIVENINEL